MGKAVDKTTDEPTSLTLDLFAPGMTMLHRAGLGGLACSLRAMERDVEAKKYKGDLPGGGGWGRDKAPPWKIEETKITLEIGKAEDARQWLKALFEYSFQISTDEPLLFLPGQYGKVAPSAPIRAYLQLAITLTFLQNGRTRNLAKKETTKTYNPEDQPNASVEYHFKALTSYKRQTEWKALTDNKGRLRTNPIEVVGPLCPGAVVRHNAFPGPTKLKERLELILPLYFALVGCLPLSINRGCGVLLIPDVQDLKKFPIIRQAMTPTTTRACQISIASDAALQTQLRVLGEKELQRGDLPACQIVTFQPTPWSTQQKSRVATETVTPPDNRSLEQFKIALQELAPHIHTREVEESQGRGKQKTVTKRTESFWVDSIVRPLVATNLARG